MHSVSKIKNLGGRGAVILQTLHRCRGRELSLGLLTGRRAASLQKVLGQGRHKEGWGRGPRFLKTGRCVFNSFMDAAMFLLGQKSLHIA